MMIVAAILAKYYDPTVSPLIPQATKIQVTYMLSSSLAATVYELLEIAALIYSFIALWIGHRSGKWAFIIYLLLGSTDYYFAKIVAVSWLTMCITNLYLLSSGIILAIAFSGSLKLNK